MHLHAKTSAKKGDFIWGKYLLVSISSEKSQLLFLSWGWKNVGGKHIWEKSEICEKKNLGKNSEFEEKNKFGSTV